MPNFIFLNSARNSLKLIIFEMFINHFYANKGYFLFFLHVFINSNKRIEDELIYIPSFPQIFNVFHILRYNLKLKSLWKNNLNFQNNTYFLFHFYLLKAAQKQIRTQS